MVVVVLAAQVVDVPGHGGQPCGDLDDADVGALLLGYAVLLHLEVDVVGAEHLHQGIGMGARLGGRSVDEPATRQAAGEGDDPPACFESRSRSTLALPRR